MRRFVSLAVLLFFTVPFGVSVIGCGRSTPSTAAQACRDETTGPIVGQVDNIVLSQSLATVGESLNYGQIGQALSASAFDCQGNSVSVNSFTYASSDLSIADINPSTGQVCAGTWNRFTGGGIPDYTICNPPANPNSTKFVAYVTATAQGATSNVVPVYVHPVVTGVVLGNPITTKCDATTPDPSSNCCSFNAPLQSGVTPYDGSSCLSQGVTGQLTGRVYANGVVSPANNITCKVGRLSFAAQGASNIFTIDPSTGVVTANQPGSATITANIANSGSAGTSGILATCPPASIVLTPTGKTGPNINVLLNNQQAFTTTVVDTNNKPITGLNLEFESTNAQTIPTSGGAVTPAFPGTATITAVCQPGTCNPSPFSQIGLYGTGKPVTSNGITVTTAGNSSSVIYAGSTSSQYLYAIDFTTTQPSSLIKLPYIPNSMVITLDGSSIYLGSPQGLMTVSTASNAVGVTNAAVTGTVLAVSPDGSTLVVSDAARQTVSLVSSSGSVSATYGAVGTSAKWSPDSQTVYITATNQQFLVHSAFSGWSSINTGGINYTDIAVTVPHMGAYFAGGTDTEGRTYCASTTVNAGTPPTTTNSFYPIADTDGAHTDRIAATNDGRHIIGASANPVSLSDVTVTYPPNSMACTTSSGAVSFQSSFVTYPLSAITVTGGVNGVVPSSNSKVAFVTYSGTSGMLPVYAPGSGAAPGYVKLSGAATAPLAGVFSTDNNTFYAGTAGDNNIHLITVNGTSATDTSTLSPKLPDANGNIVAPNLIVQRPKRATS